MSEEYLTALDECSRIVDQQQAEIDELVDMLEMIKSNAEKFTEVEGLNLYTTVFSDVGWGEINALIKKHKGE